MQVQKIQSNNASFGFNPQLNAQLMNDLGKAKKNKAYCEYLKNLCFSTNQTELKLREADKKGMPELTDKLARVFLPIKIVFTDIIDTLFPEYNYKRKELETYQEEMEARNLQNEEQHWLTTLVTHLKEDIEEDSQQLEEYDRSENAEEVDGRDLLSTIMSHMLPGAGFVSVSVVKTKGEPKEINNETENIENAEITENAENDTNKELEEKIKLGKSKVVEYVPEGYALQGLDGLGGMKELKTELKDKVIDYLKDPVQAKMDEEDYGTKLPKGLLFYGPPGCGKTTILEHLSVDAGVPLLKLETGTLKGSYIHESSIYTDAAFEYAYSIAKPEKPVIMMIDDADAFFVARNDHSHSWEAEEMTSFLNKIQEAPKKNVIVAATTNKYDIMDAAIKRRFDTQVYVGLPDEEARKSLLKLFFSRNKKSSTLANDDEIIGRLAQKTKGFPISALQDMTLEACNIPRMEAKEAKKEGKNIRRDVTEADFDKVLSKVENQNKKIKEDLYKTNATRQLIGFGK